MKNENERIEFMLRRWPEGERVRRCCLEVEYQSEHDGDVIKTYLCNTHDLNETITNGELQMCRMGKAEAEVEQLKAKAAKWEKWARQMRFAFAGVAPWEKEGGK